MMFNIIISTTLVKQYNPHLLTPAARTKQARGRAPLVARTCLHMHPGVPGHPCLKAACTHMTSGNNER